jgi:peptide/nickel transport system permease protein
LKTAMRYIARRLIHCLILLLAISFFSFLLLQWAPGDFFDSLRLDPQVSAQTVSSLRAAYGLDQSLPVRYFRWLRSAAKGELGFSVAYNAPVGPLLWARARNTLLLTGSSLLLAWLLAIPIGIWSAASKNRLADRAIGLATGTLLTLPDLLLFLALLLLALKTGWFPTGGMLSLQAEEAGFWGRVASVAAHLFLPALGLAIAGLPVLVRHVRSSMLDALESPFIRAARGHGISQRRLLFRYALPVAANPLISLFGLSLGTMLSASLLVEVILSWPGLGPLLLESILSRDAYVVVGAITVSSVCLLVGNLLADLLLFVADPRIRVQP